MRNLLKLFSIAFLFLTVAFTNSHTTTTTTDSGVFKIMEVTYLWDLLANNYEPNREQDDTWLKVGLRSKYALAKNYASLSILEETFDEDVFLRGPHHGDMDFNSTTSFGYYNPQFIAKVQDALDAALKNPVFKKVAEPFYAKHLQSMAHTYKDAFSYLKQNPDIKNRMMDEYIKMVAQPEGTTAGSLQEHFRTFAEALESGPRKADVYEGFTAPSFWVRRSIDGTDDDFIQLLEMVIEHFEAEK